MKILKLKLFQETACYKKPFAFKVAETYPLPPYSTIIGMFHKIIGAKSGEYFPMNISVQGNYESIFSNYQNLRMFKGKDQVTAMPRNVHQLLNIELLIHLKADNEIVDRIYDNIINGKEKFTIGRNEDLVKLEDMKYVNNILIEQGKMEKYSAYVPKNICEKELLNGINYRLNTTYIIENELRKWNKVDVKYVEKNVNNILEEAEKDEDGELIFFY